MDDKELFDEEVKSPEEEKASTKAILKDIVELSLYFLVVLGVSFFIVTFIGQRTVVDGSSMNPTLTDGDNLVVDKISYRFHDPERFDIIVFPYQHEAKTYYIKRIIGLPGETIYVDPDGNIFIDDVLLEEHYGKDIINDGGRASTPITLEDDEYFVMGDNRNNSCDSRDYMVGNIKKDIIVGRAVFRIYPFNQLGLVNKKW